MKLGLLLYAPLLLPVIRLLVLLLRTRRSKFSQAAVGTYAVAATIAGYAFGTLQADVAGVENAGLLVLSWTVCICIAIYFDLRDLKSQK